MRQVTAPLLALALTAFSWPTAAAQIIKGQVVDSLTGSPVGAGFVVLIDQRGSEVLRTLSDAQGRFAFETSEGSYRLRSERIGYRAWISPPIALRAGETIDYTLAIATIPTLLSAIEVTETDRCRRRPSETEDMALLWDEARKALAAAAWTIDRELFKYTLSMYERELGRTGTLRTGGERRWIREGYMRATFRSPRSATEFAEQGYVFGNEDGSWTFEAPDANVMLSDEFLATYCFTTVRDDESNRIGLAFEPLDDRGRSDIRGTLWLDEVTAELRVLEYRYTRLPHDVRDRRVGGEIWFMPVPSGAWVIREWEIRMPKVALELIGYGRRARVVGYHTAGGEVLEVRAPTGEIAYAVLAVMEGTVFDSTRMVPLAGAIVELVDTEHVTVADTTGRFRLARSIEGRHQARVRDRRLDSLGLALPSLPVHLSRGDTVRVSLAVPSMETIHATLCPQLRAGSARAVNRIVVVGTVRDADSGHPVPEAVVYMKDEGSPAGAGDPEATEVALLTDRHGRFSACGLRPEGSVTLRAQLGEQNAVRRLDFSGGSVSVDGGERRPVALRIWRQDLTVRR